MAKRRVVITGMAMLTPLGTGVDRVWQAVLAGASGIREISLFDASKFKVRIGGQVPDFDPGAFLDSKEQRRIDRFAQFAIAGASLAVEDSGIDFKNEVPDRCGVMLGSGAGGLKGFEEAGVQSTIDPTRFSPHMITRIMVNAASGQVSIRYGLEGPISAVATACASGANAIGDAYKTIIHDEADVMIAGGSEAALTQIGLGGFCAMRALSQRNDSPAAASRPFDRDRDGFVLSEGAGVLILEEYEHARARGARIYAELIGYGSTSDGVHINSPDPQGRGAARAMSRALKDGELNADQIDYVNAHGTSTELGDRAETAAIKTVFGEKSKEIAVSSTKGAMGHLIGASGSVEMILTTLSVYHGVMPPTINLEDPDPECDLDYVPNEARETPVILAMSNSFGFGGHNASLIVRAIDDQPNRARRAA